MSLQLTHQTTRKSTQKHSLILVCDNIDSPANVGGLFRMSDALGVQKIYFCGSKPDLTSVRLKRTSRNTHNYIPYRFFETTITAIEHVKENNYTPIALEISSRSTALSNYKKQINQKTALVIGNEKNGIDDQILNAITTHLHIEMCGNNSSMNVVQAASIACYSLTKF